MLLINFTIEYFLIKIAKKFKNILYLLIILYLHLEIVQGQVLQVLRHRHKLLHFVRRVDTRSSLRFEKAIPY